jgi:flagellar M-ring protein FliF
MRVAGLDPTQLRYVEDIESAYVRRIETIIEPMVGKGNFRAQVTADVDFNRVEQTDEVYKPNPSPQQAIRSQQSNEVLTRDPGAKGIPGALTNQPPVPATAPITTPAVGGAGAAADGNFLTRNASGTTNYEVDRTISHTTRATGAIRRLSVAVVLNHRTVTDKNGKETTTPLSDEEIARINNLVREAMGFNAERGDSLNVANTEFAAGITETLPELPLWKDPEIIDIGKQALRYLIVLAVLAYVAFGVIKPLLKTLTPPPAGDEEDATPGAAAGERTYDEEGEEVTLSESARQKNSYEAKLAQARETAKNNPKLVANMIKEWMGVNEEARK